MRGRTSGIAVLIALGSAFPGTVAQADNVLFQWHFTGNALPATTALGGDATLSYFDAATEGLTAFGDTATNPDVADFPDGPGTYMFTPVLDDGGRGGYAIDFVSGIAANGGPGAQYVNTYSVLFDVYIPTLDWTPFFNTNATHGNDADWYVSPSGALGIGALGYSPAGTIQAATWYRLGFVRDFESNLVTYYVNGASVFSGAAGSLDGRFSLYTSDNPGADLLIYGEGDTSGNYTNPIYTGSILFANYAFSSSEMAALGGPSFRGIPVPEPSSVVMLGLGLGTCVIAARRRHAAQRQGR